MVFSLLESTILNHEYAAPLERTGIFCLCLVLVDIFLVKGPPKHLILKLFRSSDAADSPAAARLCGQVAARIVGTLFLSVMFPRALRVISDPILAVDPIHATSYESTNCMVLAAGYFLYDIYICIARYDENGAAFFLHASVCCLAYATAIVTGHLHAIGAGFLMWELSTPFLYLRWVMLKAGLSDTVLMPLANYAFVAAFFACRVVYGPILSYQFLNATQRELKNPRPDGMAPATIYLYYVAMAVMNSLNYYWFFHMVRLALFGGKAVHKTERATETHKDE